MPTPNMQPPHPPTPGRHDSRCISARSLSLPSLFPDSQHTTLTPSNDLCYCVQCRLPTTGLVAPSFYQLITCVNACDQRHTILLMTLPCCHIGYKLSATWEYARSHVSGSAQHPPYTHPSKPTSSFLQALSLQQTQTNPQRFCFLQHPARCTTGMQTPCQQWQLQQQQLADCQPAQLQALCISQAPCTSRALRPM